MKRCFNSWLDIISDLRVIHRLALVSWSCSYTAVNTEQKCYILALLQTGVGL